MLSPSANEIYVDGMLLFIAVVTVANMVMMVGHLMWHKRDHYRER